MNAALGTAGVALGLAAAVIGAITIVLGLVGQRPALLRSSRLYVGLLIVGAVCTFVAMERALITRDFSLEYVARNGSRETPPLFNFAALWSALEGSIILWSLILTGYIAVVVHHFRKRLTDPLVGWAIAVMLVVAAFFFLLMLGPANPFKTVTGAIPTDGPGPNPLLQNHILMAFHPPMLYLGYVGFTVPFAFAIAALITGRVGEGWLVETRRWTLFAWGFLTVGIVLGAWWSYEVLGWGGYWAWDPVENASFLPWLTGTAYLHSVMVQERRGMLRVWNLSLLCATFSLTILGTFLTRSGVLDSVHAFSESQIGAYILTFFAIVVLGSIALIGWRADRLRSPGSIDSPVSREGAFLANNVLFAGFAFIVLLGTVFPLILEAANGERISIGRPYFDRMTMPIGIALLFLMAVAPALPWRKASGELLLHRLLWPAWIGTGVVVIAVAFGARGFVPLIAFGLGGFAAGAAIRQIVLATRQAGPARARRPRERRDDRARRRRGDRGRARSVVVVQPLSRVRLEPRPVRVARRPHDHLSRSAARNGRAEVGREGAGAGRRRPGLRARAVEVPRRIEHDRHAVGAHRASRRRLPHAARRPRRRQRRGATRAPRDATRHVAVDRRGPDGRRHGARGVAGSPSPADRSGVSADPRAARADTTAARGVGR